MSENRSCRFSSAAVPGCWNIDRRVMLFGQYYPTVRKAFRGDRHWGGVPRSVAVEAEVMVDYRSLAMVLSPEHYLCLLIVIEPRHV